MNYSENDLLENLLQTDENAENHHQNQIHEDEQNSAPAAGEDVSVSDIEIYPHKDDTFENIKKEFSNPTCCLKETYKRWLNLFTTQGIKIYSDNKDFIQNEQFIKMYKGKKFKNNKYVTSYICYYCKNNCEQEKNFRINQNHCFFSIKELDNITCDCTSHGYTIIEDDENNIDDLNLFRSNIVQFKKGDRISENYENQDPRDRRKFLRKTFEELSKREDKEDIMLETYNSIFFEKIIFFFTEGKGTGIDVTLKYGQEIFDDFKIYKFNNNNKNKQKASLTYFLIILILNNCSIFSIKRDILYEMIPHDLSISTYIYKRKKILENIKIDEFFKKSHLKLSDIFEYFFNEEERFAAPVEKENDRTFYNPTNFLIENCFFENELFERKNENQRFHFLDLENDGINIYPSMNANNVIQVLDQFIKNGKNTTTLYISKKDPLSRELFKKELKEGLLEQIPETFKDIPRCLMGILLIDFLNFERFFADLDKKKMIRILQLYTEKKNNIDDLDNLKTLKDIFNVISKNINDIVKIPVYDIEEIQDFSMIEKTLNLFEIKYEQKNITKFDFTFLIRNIIDHMVIEKIATKMENLHKNNPVPDDQKYDESGIDFILDENNESIQDLFDYIKKILILFCITSEGKNYIYNSTFMQELIELLVYDINYENPTDEERNFIFEIIPFLKFNFNQKVISNAFYQLTSNKKAENINVLFLSFFINDPIRENESFYDFKKYAYLFNEVKLYYILFEKKNIKKTLKIFANNENKYISFLDGIKYICLNSIQEKFEIIIDNNNEKNITEETEYCYNAFHLLVNLKSLLNTNYLIHYKAGMPLLENKLYDISSIFKHEKIPFFMKSLLLDYLLQYTMTFKVDKRINHAEFYPYGKKKREENTTKHIDSIILLLNLYMISLDLINDISENDLKIGFIEKNGLYDFCMSIIKGFNSFNNFSYNIIATFENDYDRAFCDYYNRLIVKFIKNKDKLSLCLFNKKLNNNIELEKKRKKLKQNLKKACAQQLLYGGVEWFQNIFLYFSDIFQKFSHLLDDPSLPISSSVYYRFKTFNNGNLFSPNSDDAYSYLFHYRPEEISEDDAIDFNIDIEILENYKSFCNFIEKENIKWGIDLVLSSFDSRIGNYTVREYFFVKYFIKILPNHFDSFFNDAIILNAFTKLIIYDKKLINFENIGNKLEILENYGITEYNENTVKSQIIATIFKKLNYVVNYEISIANSFCNTPHEIKLSEYANALIVFTQVLGENFNTAFHEAIFELEFDFQDEKNLKPIAKFDESSQTFISLNTEKKSSLEIDEFEVKRVRRLSRRQQVKTVEKKEKEGELTVADIDINKGCVPYLLLLILYQKIFDILYSKEKKIIIQDNLIMIFHSLTNCLEEFSHVKDQKHKNILSIFLTEMFSQEKVAKLLTDYNYIRLWQKEEKLDFIINDLLVLLNVYISNDDRNIMEFYATHQFFKECYLEWLTVEYFAQTLEKLGVTKKITNEELFEFYNEKKLDKIPMFHLVIKYYEILYMLVKDFNLNEYQIFLSKDINEKKLAKYIGKCKEQYGIDVLLDSDEREIRKTMYKFLNTIFMDLEIRYEDENKIERVTTILQSEINYLSEESKKNYLDNVDRSAADTKLLSIYDNLDSLLFEMIANANKKHNPLEIKDYKFLENINFLFILLYNIIMVYLYYKPPNTPLNIYNQFEPEKYHLQNTYILPILTICHFALLGFVFISWYKNKFFVKYFYDLSQFVKENVTEKEKLPIEKKAIIFKELVENFSRNITTIWKFFPGLSFQKKIEIGIVDSILLNYQIMPFWVTLFCLIMYYLSSQMYLILPVLLFAKFVPTLSAIFSGLAGKFKYLITVYIYTFTALYVFSWAGFILLPRMFNKDVVFENPETEVTEEAMCSSSLQCILYFLNFGLTEANAGMDVLSYRDNVNYYFRQFIFDLCYNLLVNMIFANVFTGLITDAFGENREKVWLNEIDKEEKCFICQITKSECINSHIDFNDHRDDHSVWKYIYFLCGIVLKSQTEFNFEENYVWKKFKETNIDWFPTVDGSNDVKDVVKENGEKLDKVLDMVEEIRKK